MTDRLLVDVGADGRVSVSAWLGGEALPSPAGEAAELVWPLDADALEELRWYLEDYLWAPFGVYEERGPRVAGRLREWGQAVFAAVFGAGPARDAYVRMRSRAGADVEIVFRSSEPGWLGLPWELLCDPERPMPVALDQVGVSRSLPAAALAESLAVGGERLRVLMVISRPAGAADVGYRMIARPLLERLEAVRGSVELVVLRPPTLDHLAEVLSQACAAGEPFQVVHFDGHGTLNRRAAGSGAPPAFESPAEQGMLVFEKPSGGTEDVPAAEVARVLAAAQVPVVVLNACQSGAIGKELEAAIATRLLQEGAASVVAMAYSVYAVAVAEFMAAFYERLFAGDRVSEAVSAGRNRLARRAERPSLKGPMPLADWIVPVHYLRRDVHFPDLQTAPTPELSQDELLDRLRERPVEDASAALAPVDAFVGRDGLFHTLEVAARSQRVVVLHGQAGTGKTELAKAFGRWWRDSGGAAHPEWVIWYSFTAGLASFGLDGVVAEIGLHVFGTDFARLDLTERRKVVLALVARRRLLLIWDNVESVHSMPDPTAATPPLDATGLAELKEFLKRITAGGCSAVLVTSRTEETWLGPSLRRIPVGGLTLTEAIEYADQVLAPYPAAAPRRAPRAFAELMEWLNGHPLSMRVILPYLDTTDPQALLAELHGITALPGRDLLSASLAYSIDHLPTDTRGVLVALSLFQGATDADVLGFLSARPDVPRRFHGTAEDWARALEQAAGVGLLSPLGGRMYRIHPVLPACLAERWRREEPEDYDHQRSATQAALLDAYVTLGYLLDEQISCGDSALAFAVIHHQCRMLGSLLGYALNHGLWTEAKAIAQPLDAYWDSRGLTQEAQGWVDRGRLALEDTPGTPPPLDDPAGALWLFLVISQAKRQITAQQFDAAERTYLDIQHILQQQPESTQQRERLGMIHHQLGMVARGRGLLDDAWEWFLKSLAIVEELGDRSGMARSYYQLGMVALGRGLWDDAREWFLKSLTIVVELGDRSGMARSYYQLGMVALGRGLWDDAREWFLKSLTIVEELGDRSGMARSYYQLGMVALDRGLWDDAREWFLKSLTIVVELGDRPGIADCYHQFGTVALGRGLRDDAREWFLKSLAINEDLGNRWGIADCYRQLGLVALLQGRPEAQELYLKSMYIEDQGSLPDNLWFGW